MELAPYDRYGIDSLRMWPRVLQVVPPALAGVYHAGKTWLDLALNFATVCALLAPVPLLVAPLARSWSWTALLALLAYLLYRLSLPFAMIMRTAFEEGFDLHRGDLLKRWGIVQPATVQEEQAVWRALSNFLSWNDPRLFPEEHRQ
jgi:hypothetical protein